MKKEDIQFYREIIKRKQLAHPAFPALTLIDRIGILNERINDIKSEKSTILSMANAKNYTDLTSNDVKLRYKLLNKERKGIQDTLDRVGVYLKEQEERNYGLACCENL